MHGSTFIQPGWRNRQTRRPQTPLPTRHGGSSPSPGTSAMTSALIHPDFIPSRRNRQTRLAQNQVPTGMQVRGLPRGPTIGGVAQLVEQRTLTPHVARSNRAALANSHCQEPRSSGSLPCERGFSHGPRSSRYQGPIRTGVTRAARRVTPWWRPRLVPYWIRRGLIHERQPVRCGLFLSESRRQVDAHRRRAVMAQRSRSGQ